MGRRYRYFIRGKPDGEDLIFQYGLCLSSRFGIGAEDSLAVDK